MDIAGLIGFDALTIRSLCSSIQTGEVTIASGAASGTATISAVDVSRAFIIWNDERGGDTSFAMNEDCGKCTLTNTTTVTGTTNTANAGASRIIRFTVFELAAWAVTSVEYGTATIAASATAGNATLATSVDLSRSMVCYLGYTTPATSTDFDKNNSYVQLADASTVTATRGASSSDAISVNFVVVQWAAGVTRRVQQVLGSIGVSGTQSENTTTITSVDPSKTLSFYGGQTGATNSLLNKARAVLTDNTTYTFTRESSNSLDTYFALTAVEFSQRYLKSVQRGTDTIALSNTTLDKTITSVNSAKAIPIFLGSGYQSFSTAHSTAYGSIKLTSNTNLRLERSASSATSPLIIAWEVGEWW